MLNGFRQGIVSYSYSGNIQTFLARSGNNVSLITTAAPVNYTIAQGSSNYLFTESNTITGAWTNVSSTVDTWLYWDINIRTGVRTFGSTTIQPVSQPVQPTPVTGLHWYDTANFKHFFYDNGRWIEVLRVFAAKVFGNVFTPLGLSSTAPFAGTQIGASGVQSVDIGRVIFDDTGLPIVKQSGEFFTSVTEAFTDASLINTLRVEATVLEAQAAQNLAAYQVVQYNAFNSVLPAGYNDVQQTAIAITLQSATISQVTSLCIQGVVTNPAWNWPFVGAALWVSESGELVFNDPNITNPTTYPEPRPPVARVLSPTQIFFDQGLGTRGPRGFAGISPSVTKASNSAVGTTYLSVEPDNLEFPIAVGTNDPRLEGPRTPTAHTHTPSQILTQPTGSLTGDNMQQMLVQIADELDTLDSGKLGLTGGNLVGPVTTSVPITQVSQLVTKQYVDSRVTPVSVSAGSVAYGSTDGSLTGISTYQLFPLAITTTNDDALVQLRSPTGIIGVPIPQNSVCAFQVNVIGRSNQGNALVVKYDAVIKRDDSPTSVILIGNTLPTRVYDDLISVTWQTDIITDTNSGALLVVVTGAANTTIKWSANITMTSVVT